VCVNSLIYTLRESGRSYGRVVQGTFHVRLVAKYLSCTVELSNEYIDQGFSTVDNNISKEWTTTHYPYVTLDDSIEHLVLEK